MSDIFQNISDIIFRRSNGTNKITKKKHTHLNLYPLIEPSSDMFIIRLYTILL